MERAKRDWWLSACQGGLAVAACLLLALGLSGFGSTVRHVTLPATASAVLNQNWLALFAGYNLGVASYAEFATLHWVDYALLCVIGALFIILFVRFFRRSVLWTVFSAWATLSPLLGVWLLATTHTAGRTGLLTATFVWSVLLAIDGRYGTVVGWFGMASSSILLLMCDFLSQRHVSPLYAIPILLGYILWMVWLLMIGFGWQSAPNKGINLTARR